MHKFFMIVFFVIAPSVFGAKILRPIWGSLPKNHDTILDLNIGSEVEISVLKRWWTREIMSVEMGLGLEGSHRGFISSEIKLQLPNVTPFWPSVSGRIKGVVGEAGYEWHQDAMIGGNFHMGDHMEMRISKGVDHVWFGLRYRV